MSVPEPISVTRTNFGGVGHCIYCQASGVVLTDEHVIPYFMGGTTVLENSSCTACNKITAKLDGYCANRIYRIFRHRIGLPSRTKSRPETIEVLFETPSGPVVRNAQFDEAPHFMVLPEFDPPGLRTETDYGETVDTQGLRFWLNADVAARLEKMRQPEDTSFTIQTGANWSVFCRFIAKTALALAVATFGYDSRKSYLPDIILGKEPKMRQYVGGAQLYKLPEVRAIPHYGPMERHTVFFQKYDFIDTSRPSLLEAQIGFFSELRAPVYAAIIGPAPEGDLEKLLRSPL